MGPQSLHPAHCLPLGLVRAGWTGARRAVPRPRRPGRVVSCQSGSLDRRQGRASEGRGDRARLRGLHRRHPAAFLGAGPAGLGARAAVLVRVPLAFVCAGIARRDARSEERRAEAAAAREECGQEPTEIGAVAVQSNASHEVADSPFIHACVCAVLARLCAFAASLDAACNAFRIHRGLLPAAPNALHIPRRELVHAGAARGWSAVRAPEASDRRR